MHMCAMCATLKPNVIQFLSLRLRNKGQLLCYDRSLFCWSLQISAQSTSFASLCTRFDVLTYVVIPCTASPKSDDTRPGNNFFYRNAECNEDAVAHFIRSFVAFDLSRMVWIRLRKCLSCKFHERATPIVLIIILQFPFNVLGQIMPFLFPNRFSLSSSHSVCVRYARWCDLYALLVCYSIISHGRRSYTNTQ